MKESNEAEPAQQNPTVQRLEDQISWYGKKSGYNQKYFKRLKIVELVAAALIPFIAGFNLPVAIAGGLGVLIVVLEGIQALNRYSENWMSYRSTAEELKHEKYLWLAKAGQYANASNPDTLLAERIEALISREHAKWVTIQEKVLKEPDKPSGM